MPSQDTPPSFSLGFKDYKAVVIVPSTAGDDLQIIGAGLPRCGTSSLKLALEILGFGPCHHMIVIPTLGRSEGGAEMTNVWAQDCFDHPDRSDAFNRLFASQSASTYQNPERLEALQKLMRGYRATVDAPCCDLYRELMVLYPDSKVILSVRDSADQWWHSFDTSIGMVIRQPYGLLVYTSDSSAARGRSA